MLDDRKLTILTEIVDYYIQSAEPIGSRTLSKITSIGLSPATIRNEMSDLEDMGFLTKAHISSGRIPSDKGYRIYVNTVLESGMNLNKKIIDSTRKDLLSGSGSLRDLYESANRMLSKKTNHITLILSPVANSITIEHIKVDKLNSGRILFFIVGSGGSSSSYILYNVREDLNFEKLENNLTKLLVDKDSQQILHLIEKIPHDLKHRELYLRFFNSALSFLKEQDTYNVFLNGIGNIMNFWNEDAKTVRSLMNFLEDDKSIIQHGILKEIDKQLDVRIGEENEDKSLKETSVITSSYKNRTGNYGNIILIGPKRMNYRKLANILYNFSISISGL